MGHYYFFKNITNKRFSGVFSYNAGAQLLLMLNVGAHSKGTKVRRVIIFFLYLHFVVRAPHTSENCHLAPKILTPKKKGEKEDVK